MAEKRSRMYVVLVSLFALLLRYMYIRAQRDSTDNQVKEAKDNADIYTTENRRTPQNVMRTGEMKWFSVQDRVVKYTMYPPILRGDPVLEDIISEIQRNTCLGFRFVPAKVPTEAERKYTICYLPDFSRRNVTEQKMRRVGFQALFRCLGKRFEHKRRDRDRYVWILGDNIDPAYLSRFQIVRKSVTQGLPYDFGSIMNLKHDAYSKNGLSTIIPVNDSIPKEMLGQSTYPSQQDYLDIQLTYCGTETAVGSVTVVKVETTYISVTWTKPKYSPVRMRVDYQYSLLCEEQPYFKQQAYIPITYVGMNFTGMKPGSVCKVNFAVFYNPSEFDRGVNYVFVSLHSKPTAPPEKVKIRWFKAKSARLSWKAIPCPHQHGMILRYLVRHDYELPNKKFAEQHSETIGNALDVTLRTLRPNRNYAIKVAGVNEAGVGTFSPTLQIVTPGVRPGRVRITSIKTTCHNITIRWIAPLDENDDPYGVMLKYSYKGPHERGHGTIVEPPICTKWTVENIPSDTSVKFSLTAINRRSKEGPTLHTTVKTNKT